MRRCSSLINSLFCDQLIFIAAAQHQDKSSAHGSLHLPIHLSLSFSPPTNPSINLNSSQNNITDLLSYNPAYCPLSPTPFPSTHVDRI